MVHMTRNIIYMKVINVTNRYAIDNLIYQTKKSILLSYCIMVAPFTLLILIHCKEKAENINKAWPNYIYRLISPVSQVR